MTRLRWQTTSGLAAFISLALALTTVLIGLAAYHVTHEALEIQLDHRIAIETQALLAQAGDGDIAALAALIHKRDSARSTASLGYILIDVQGRRLAGQLNAQAPASPGFLEFLHYDGGTRIAQAITTILPGGERLVVAADREVIDDMDATIAKLFSAALAAMLILSVAGAWAVGSMTRSRLRAIDGAARSIIAGDLRQRMPIDGSDSEFDRVSATLNQMLDRIGLLLDNLRQVSSDVAHDLRTPLTRLRNHLDEASRAQGADKQQAIDAASIQAQELLDLFAALLRISEVESGNLRAGFRTVSLSEIAQDLVESYRPDLEASDHRIAASIEAGIVLQGDPRLLRQLIANLLDNALRHTPAGTQIVLIVAKQGAGTTLVIGDDGPGVSSEDAARLFARFSRTERSRSTSGHGLGLALVAAIAQIHGGTATIGPRPGFRIDVTFS